MKLLEGSDLGQGFVAGTWILTKSLVISPLKKKNLLKHPACGGGLRIWTSRWLAGFKSFSSFIPKGKMTSPSLKGVTAPSVASPTAASSSTALEALGNAGPVGDGFPPSETSQDRVWGQGANSCQIWEICIIQSHACFRSHVWMSGGPVVTWASQNRVALFLINWDSTFENRWDDQGNTVIFGLSATL